MRSCLCFLAMFAFARVCSSAEPRIERYQRYGNRIEVRNYEPTTRAYQSSLKPLNDQWDTQSAIRWDIALVLAQLSQAVYENNPSKTDVLLMGLGFTQYIIIDQSPHFAFIARNSEVTVVVLRGTDQFEDWLTNLDAGFVVTPKGRFHKGFRRAYQAVQRNVNDFLTGQSTRKLWVTGHSLGGAMAVVCALDLQQNMRLDPQLVTFGQPRVGDSSAARWIDSLFPYSYARFVHGNDIVPSIPPTVRWVMPYGHAGKLIAVFSDQIHLASSTQVAEGVASAYCGNCGRSRLVHVGSVYQPSIEPPPMTEQQFEQLKAVGFRAFVQTAPAAQDPFGQEQVLEGYWISLVRDHYMDGYFAAIASYADGQPAMSIPAVPR